MPPTSSCSILNLQKAYFMEMHQGLLETRATMTAFFKRVELSEFGCSIRELANQFQITHHSARKLVVEISKINLNIIICIPFYNMLCGCYVCGIVNNFTFHNAAEKTINIDAVLLQIVSLLSVQNKVLFT